MSSRCASTIPGPVGGSGSVEDSRSVEGSGIVNDFGRGGSASRRGDGLADISPLSLTPAGLTRQQGGPGVHPHPGLVKPTPSIAVRAANGRELLGVVPDGAILAPSAG